MSKRSPKEEAQARKKQEAAAEAFARVLSRKYVYECKRQQVEPTYEGLMQFIIKRNLVRPIDICRYMVNELYPEAMYKNDGCKTGAVRDLEDRLPVAERAIWEWTKKGFRRQRYRGDPEAE